MSIGEICVRNVVCAGRDATVMEAAALMREHHVGGVIIVDPAQDGRIPVGIVTDRDIVVETVAAGVDPQSVRVGDLLKRPIATVTEDMGYAETISKIPGVIQAEDVTGPYDVIVRAQADTVDALGRMVVAKVQQVDGITRTLTCPVVHL